MVKVIPYLASLLAIGQAAAAAKAVSSFSEWVDGIIANPDGDHLTPEQAVEAFHAGNFTAPSAKLSRHKRASSYPACYEHPNEDALITDAVACVNTVARTTPAANCKNRYLQCHIGTAVITTDGRTGSVCNDVARGAGQILDRCVVKGSNRVEGADFAYGNGEELVRIRRENNGD